MRVLVRLGPVSLTLCTTGRATLRISIVLLAILWHGERAEGCSCGTPPTCATVWDAELVFVGTATQVSGDRGSEQAQFTVQEWVRGERVGQQVTLVSEGISALDCAVAPCVVSTKTRIGPSIAFTFCSLD